MKKVIIIFGILIVFIAVVFSLRFLLGGSEDNWLCRSGEWVKHGNPRVPPPAMPCAKNGEELIRVKTPPANAPVNSPLTISGEARGVWYSEGGFPVRLISLNGRVLASGTAEAQGEWMAEDFVPFMSVINFRTENNILADLILDKANPSGLPKNDDSLTIPLLLNKNIGINPDIDKTLSPPPPPPAEPPIGD